MIQQKILLAFEELFPPTDLAKESLKEVEPVEDEKKESKKKKAKKIPPRTNGVITTAYEKTGYHIDVQLDPSQLLEAVTILDENDFFIESITGVDWIKEDQLEAVYDFSRYDFDCCRVVIRTRTSRTEPKIPSICNIYRGANWHERETHDFFGIKFEGHPHLIPLLLPEDADFHPLLKDFKA